MTEANQGFVYILHLTEKLSHARHYVGWSMYPDKRLDHHRAGNGARFTQVCNEKGIAYSMVICVPGSKTLERKLKNRKNTGKYCPICSGTKVRIIKE